MGWGYGLYAKKNKGTPKEESVELVYWHKFDDLAHEFLPVPEKLELARNGLKIQKLDLKAILDIITTTPDYWDWSEEGELIVPGVREGGGFSTVSRVCEILHHYDEIVENGWQIYFYYT